MGSICTEGPVCQSNTLSDQVCSADSDLGRANRPYSCLICISLTNCGAMGHLKSIAGH